MRFNRFTLKDFLAYEEATLDLALGKVFIFSGPTGSGKSTILDAARWMLKCKVRGIELAAEEVRRIGATGKVMVESEMVGVGGEVITHKRTLTTETFTNGQLEEKLGVPLHVLHAALDASRFLTMKPEEQVRLVHDIAGETVNDEMLREKGLDNEELIKRVRTLGLKSALALATQHRRSCETRLREMRTTPPADVVPEGAQRNLSELDLAVIEAKIVEVRKHRDTLRDRIAATKGSGVRREDAEKAVAEAEQKIAETEGRLEAAKAALAALKEPDGVKEGLAKVRKERAALEKATVGLLADVKSLKDQYDAITAEYREAESMPDGAMCPKCRRDISQKALLEVLKEEAKIVRDRHESAKLAYRQAETQMSALHAKGEELSSQLEGHDEAKANLSGEAKTLTSQLGVLRLMLGQTKERAASVPSEPVDVAKQEYDLTACDERISTLERVRNEVVAFQKGMAAYEEAEKTKKAETARRDAYKNYEAILGPTGIVAQALAVPLVEMRKHIATMEQVVWGRNAIAVGDDLSVTMDGKAYPMLSSGERLLLSAVVTAALCRMAKVGVMFVDDVSLIDAASRDRFLSLLITLAKAGDIEQVFLCLTRDRSGYCPACQKPRVAKADQTCSDCGAAVGPAPIRGHLVGTVRQFSVFGGKVAEVAGEK